MTVEQLLTLVDASKPNEQPDEAKIAWIRDVEGRVLSEIHGIPLENIKLPEGNDDILALPEAYTKIYVLYIMAMIEFYSKSYTGYSRFAAEFEAALSMYAKYFIRNRT